jgi:hypothetical protein
MLDEIIPFSIYIPASTIAGVSLWTLVLYWSFDRARDWVAWQLQRWFNFAERSLYTSAEEYERTRIGRESQNAFWASIFSPIPFAIGGVLMNYAIDTTLGNSWTISLGILFCMAAGLYAIGRQQQEDDDEDDDDE